MCKISTTLSDGTDEMRVNRLDERTADRLLSGAVGPDDAPPGYAGVARLLESAGSPAGNGAGPAREAATVAAMQAAVLGHLVPVPDPGEKRKVLSKVMTVKAAGVAAAVLLGGGTAAAATGSLPGPAQNAAAHVFSSVGIDMPDGGSNGPHGHGHGNGHAESNATGTDQSGGTSTGPNSHALPGLCNAAKHNGTSTGHPPGKSTVFSTLVCTGVSAPGNSGNSGPGDTGTTDDSGQGTSGDTPESSTPTGGSDTGKPPSTPASGTAPVPTPNSGTGDSGGGAPTGHSHS